MNKKNKKIGIVYSTNPDFVYQYENENTEPETLEPSKQKLYISLDKKNRSGKQVTLIENFIGKQEDLDSLHKYLKNKCSVGGSIKDNTIILQGDQRQKVEKYLIELGYKIVRKN